MLQKPKENQTFGPKSPLNQEPGTASFLAEPQFVAVAKMFFFLGINSLVFMGVIFVLKVLDDLGRLGLLDDFFPVTRTLHLVTWSNVFRRVLRWTSNQDEITP